MLKLVRLTKLVAVPEWLKAIKLLCILFNRPAWLLTVRNPQTTLINEAVALDGISKRLLLLLQTIQAEAGLSTLL